MINYLDDLYAVKDILLDNKVILSPTDTVWGLNCDSFSKSAIEKIKRIKQRNEDKPFILILDTVEHLKKYIVEIHPRIENLLHYHLRPISVIYKASVNLPFHLSTEKGTVAIRITRDPFLSDLIKLLGRPLVSTSANIQSEPTPSFFEQIDEQIKSQVDYICKTGRSKKHNQLASMLISFDPEGELVFHRK